MKYYFPFGEELKPLKQQDRTPKKVFVLGVYASAVHARWSLGPRKEDLMCAAMAVASEPRIFWDGNPDEAAVRILMVRLPRFLMSIFLLL